MLYEAADGEWCEEMCLGEGRERSCRTKIRRAVIGRQRQRQWQQPSTCVNFMHNHHSTAPISPTTSRETVSSMRAHLEKDRERFFDLSSHFA